MVTLRARNVGCDEDSPMWARARGWSLGRPRPALENLSGRTPRGLVAAYPCPFEAAGVSAERRLEVGDTQILVCIGIQFENQCLD